MQHETVKIIGRSGQVSLGKEFAGRTVLIETIGPGVWQVRLGTFIPDNERGLWEPDVKARLDEAEKYAAKNPPRETSSSEIRGWLRRAGRTSAKRTKRSRNSRKRQ